MPLDRFVLLLILVVVAAGVTVGLGAMLAGGLAAPGLALAVSLPIGLIAYVIIRIVIERMKNSEDDHYDHIER